MKRYLKCLFPFLVLGLAGCSTVSSRIKQHQAEFNQLDANSQAKIREGTVDVGFTPDMVYMALGSPDAKRERRTARGDNEVWIYQTTYETYEGSRVVSYHRWYRFDPVHRRYHVFWGPEFADVYATHREDAIRVTFSDGRVVSIDQKAA